MGVSPTFCNHCGASNSPTENTCCSCGYPLSASTSTTRALSTSAITRQLPSHTLLKQRYLILQVLGQGGMGAVYLAQDTTLGDRLVAVKEMSQQSSEQAQETIDSFKREAHLLASLQHPNLPSIYDHFEENGRWYLVMSFIQGETLEDYLARVPDQKLSLEEVLPIGLELCSVLTYLHTHQPPIIFRDLKPDNIMRTTDGHFYLIDFGIARHFKPGQAKDTANYGSAGYAPPEQYGKAQTTERSDVYSLGATLYQLLSGHDPSLSPFRFPPLQSLVPTLPEQLTRLITQMLEMDESKRPASIQEVQQTLQAVSLPAPVGQYGGIPTTPQQTTPMPLLAGQSPTSSLAQTLRMQRQQFQSGIYASPASAQPSTTMQTPSNPGLEEILATIAMLVGIASAVVGMFALVITLRDHHDVLASISPGGLFLSLGTLAVVVVRSRVISSLTARIQKIEIITEILAGLLLITLAIFGVIVTYVGFAQETGALTAGVITAENMLSMIIGLAICLLVYNRIKKNP